MTTPSSAHLDFVIIGAMKCGTTSLFDLLSSHPRVFAPRNKEPHYFTRGYAMPAAYYRSLFRGRGPDQICGEASPTYSWVHRYPDCPRRIATDAPDARIVYVVRDPLDRVMSHLRHQLLLGRRSDTPEVAMRMPALWERSAYRTTIDAYLEHIDLERLLVVDLDDLRTDERWIQRVFTFLELEPDPHTRSALPTSNASVGRTAVPSFVSRVATTPVGAIMRDLVSRELLQRMKKPLTRTVEPHALRGEISIEDLRRALPEQCVEVDAQYRWVRNTFIDGTFDATDPDDEPPR